MEAQVVLVAAQAVAAHRHVQITVVTDQSRAEVCAIVIAAVPIANMSATTAISVRFQMMSYTAVAPTTLAKPFVTANDPTISLTSKLHEMRDGDDRRHEENYFLGSQVRK